MSNIHIKDYPDITYISKKDLDTNDSLVKMLAMVGKNKRVIDFGCATGYFAKLLSAEGCKVVGVEINPEAAKVAEEYCQKVLVADLDNVDLGSLLGDEKFDVATFGDVLEHLKDPWSFLSSVKEILTTNGCVVASVPNIAHGSIRLALAEGRFEYEELGIMDRTHLRFFTHASLHELFESAGYGVESEDSVIFPIFNDSELTPNIEQKKFPNELIDFLHQDKHSHALQFVVRAYPWSMAYEHGLLKKEHDQLRVELHNKQLELQQVQQQLQQAHSKIEQTQAELKQHFLELQSIEQSKTWRLNRKWDTFKRVFKRSH